MRRKPENRFLALAAAQTTPVPPPGREWTDEEQREMRVTQARDYERAWVAQREALIERHPGVDPWRLAQSNSQLRELDEALEAVRERLAEARSRDGLAGPGNHPRVGSSPEHVEP